MAQNLWQDASMLIKREVGPKIWKEWFNAETVLKTEQRGDIFYICLSDEWAKTTLQFYLDVIEESLYTIGDEHLNVILVDMSHENIPSRSLQEAMPVSLDMPFNPRYTFDSFVVGSSNRFAHAAAMAVAESPSRSYNPLFIYGGSGLGKTHLMHAIGQAVLKKNPYKKVVYVSSETFTNEFIYLLRENKLEAFKGRYRAADILLIDDIQFLTNKTQIQEEFFHTFNALHDAGKQIVISSDRAPKDLNPLEERLRSRFEWGLMTDIQAPDWETRCAILQRKAIIGGVPINDDVVFTLAEKIPGNIRELEGALNKLMYYSELNQHNSIDMKLAQEALRDIFLSEETPHISIPLIQRLVADYFEINVEEMKSKRKSQDVAFPRQVAMYLCRDVMGATQTQIGREFGGKDHTTVIHACDKITAQRMRDPMLDKKIRDIEKKLLNK